MCLMANQVNQKNSPCPDHILCLILPFRVSLPTPRGSRSSAFSWNIVAITKELCGPPPVPKRDWELVCGVGA